jgi:hypothetical protein
VLDIDEALDFSSVLLQYGSVRQLISGFSLQAPLNPKISIQ